jgi:Flp pilus assembly protein TadD
MSITINPEFRQAYVNLAVAERRLGRLTEAEQVLREGMKVYPEDGLMLANLGRLEQDRGDTLQAVALYRQALEFDPDDTNIAYNLANLLMTQRRFEECIPYFEMVVNRNPRDAEAWINLGASRDFLGDSGGAMQAFQQALLIDPNRPEPYFNIFRGLIAAGDTTRAVTVLESYAFRDSTTQFGEVARRLLDELGASP